MRNTQVTLKTCNEAMNSPKKREPIRLQIKYPIHAIILQLVHFDHNKIFYQSKYIY